MLCSILVEIWICIIVIFWFQEYILNRPYSQYDILQIAFPHSSWLILCMLVSYHSFIVTKTSQLHLLCKYIHVIQFNMFSFMIKYYSPIYVQVALGFIGACSGPILGLFVISGIKAFKWIRSRVRNILWAIIFSKLILIIQYHLWHSCGLTHELHYPIWKIHKYAQVSSDVF